MKKRSRPFWIGVCLLIIWISACSLPVQTAPTPIITMPPEAQLASPSPNSAVVPTSTPLTPVIPITGENVVEMQCQFCVNGLTHTVLIFPDFAIFDVETSSLVTCLTAEVVNGKRVLICNGTQQTTFNLKICSDSSNCLLYPVVLQPCPLLPNTGVQLPTTTPLTPVFLTPINTLRAPARTPTSNDSTPAPSQNPTSIAPTTTLLPTIPPVLTTVAPPPTPTAPEATATAPPATGQPTP